VGKNSLAGKLRILLRENSARITAETQIDIREESSGAMKGEFFRGEHEKVLD
jgi:hypothetical protein